MSNTAPPRIIFAGTPEFAVPALEALLATQGVCAVYTQPDRPAGRGRKLKPSPVKVLAQAANIPVYQPVSLRPPEAQDELAALQPDLMVVVAYGLLLPQAVLDMPRLGCINVHASLLPRWRGAAPIQRALLAGDTETGVTLMQMEAGLDTGPMLGHARLPIKPDMTAGDLHDQLSLLGAQMLRELLPDLLAQRISPQVQDDAQACYAAKLSKAEAMLDWQQSAQQLERQVRAFNPWPIAQTTLNDQVLRVWRARVIVQSEQAVQVRAGAQPGQIVSATRDGLAVVCGDGVLLLTEVQLPGKRPQQAADFINAHDVQGMLLQ